MKFKKYSGHGNDFILIDLRSESIEMTKELIIRICDRRFGVGGDGVILIDSSNKDCDYSLRIWNLDGSEAYMCGNAARIAVAYNHGLSGQKSFRFDTKNSIYSGKMVNEEAIIEMTELFDVDAIDISDLSVLGGMFLNTGVPHTVIQIKDIDKLDIIKEGSKIRHDKRFKDGTNVCFFEVVSNKEIKFRVFERGIEGETLCCGTGVIAAAVTCKELFNWTGKIKVHCARGEVFATINKDLTELLFAGKVSFCFNGEFSE